MKHKRIKAVYISPSCEAIAFNTDELLEDQEDVVTCSFQKSEGEEVDQQGKQSFWETEEEDITWGNLWDDYWN